MTNKAKNKVLVKKLAEQAKQKFVCDFSSIIHYNFEESIEEQLKQIDWKNFRSRAGALLYLSSPPESIVVLSFNKPLWAHQSCTSGDSNRPQNANPNHILDLMTNKEAILSNKYVTGAYTGGLIGIVEKQFINMGRRINRFDLEINPFEYLFGANGVADRVNQRYHKEKIKGPKKLIGAGPWDVTWLIKVPSEAIADYRILGSVNWMREILGVD